MVEKKGLYVKVGVWEKTPEETTIEFDRLYIGSPLVDLEETLKTVRRKLLELKEEEGIDKILGKE